MEQPPDDSRPSTDSASLPPTPEILRVNFYATPAEYFRIWIVNLGLTIVTLGIYSAWAKVRTKKYLYGNIEVAGARLDYHADPVRILIGRVLIGVLFIGYSLGGRISPMIALAFAAFFGLLFPWILVRGLIFALSNTSYRGVRFGFEKDYRGSYAAYIKGFLITVFTLGLAGPYSVKLHMLFKLNRIRFGTQKSSFDAPTEVFFKICYAGYALMFLCLPVVVAAIVIFKNGPKTMVGVIVFYAGVLFAGAYLRARFINLTMNQTKFGPVEVRSHITARGLAEYYFTNLIACALTLGMAIPWAVIRTMKYRLANMQVWAPENALETIEAGANVGSTNAGADAAVDFWDIDLGF